MIRTYWISIALVVSWVAVLRAQSPAMRWHIPTTTASAFATSDDGRRLVTASANLFEAWDITDFSAPRLLMTTSAHTWDYNEFYTDSILTLYISHDGSTGGYLGSDTRVHAFDLRTGGVAQLDTASARQVLLDRKKTNPRLLSAGSPDSELHVVCDRSSFVVLDTAGNTILPGNASSAIVQIMFSPDSRKVAYLDAGGTVYEVGIPHRDGTNSSSHAPHSCIGIGYDAQSVLHVIIGDDSTLIVDKMGLKIWTVKSGAFRLPEYFADPLRFCYEAPGGAMMLIDLVAGNITPLGRGHIAVQTMTWSPDDQKLALAADSAIELVRASDGVDLGVFQCGTRPVSLAFNSRATKIAYLANNAIGVLDLSSGKLISHPIALPFLQTPFEVDAIGFEGATDNLVAIADTVVWHYRLEADSGLTKAYTSGRSKAISKDGSALLYQSTLLSGAILNSSDLSLRDSVHFFYQFGSQPWTAAVFAETKDQIFYSNGAYDPVENFDQGFVAEYNVQGDSSSRIARGAADEMLANGRWIFWKLNTPYDSRLRLFDRNDASMRTWTAPARLSALAIGSDTTHRFVTAGEDGITMWTLDSVTSGVARTVWKSSRLSLRVLDPNRLRVTFDGEPNEMQTFRMCDLAGKDVISSPLRGDEPTTFDLDIAKLAKGSYFVVLQTTHGTESLKFQIAR